MVTTVLFVSYRSKDFKLNTIVAQKALMTSTSQSNLQNSINSVKKNHMILSRTQTFQEIGELPKRNRKIHEYCFSRKIIEENCEPFVQMLCAQRNPFQSFS